MKETPKDVRNSILVNAEQLVNGDRQRDYGHPYDDFTRTARMASGLGFRMVDHQGNPRELNAKDIPMFMILVKLSRESNRHKEDNLTDCIGYVKTLDMVIQKEEELCNLRNTLSSCPAG